MYKLEEYIVAEHDDTANKDYLLDLESGIMFDLNPTAKAIVESIKKAGTIDSYVKDIVSQFDVSEDVVRADCNRFIAVLIEKQYIREC